MFSNSIKTTQTSLQKGALTSVELTAACFNNIKAHQKQGGCAWISTNESNALAQAKLADDRRSLDHNASPLLGIPIAIKDSFDIKGEITGAGSKLFTSHKPAQKDTPVIAHLRQAGAIFLGRNNMSEFAFSGLGYNPHFGTPTHPLVPAQIAGGSTSGGAVSVAGNMAFAALGSDTGGSLRIPAAFCDLVGFKPSANRISRQGVTPLSYSYDSIGTIAKTVSDCITMDQILSHTSYAMHDLPLRGLRLFITDDYVMEDLAPEVGIRFVELMAKLSGLGAHIIPFDFKALNQIPQINAKGGLTAAEIWCEHESFFDEQRHLYDPLVATRIERGRHITAADYLKIQHARQKVIETAHHHLVFADAWLMPTVAIMPPKLIDLKDEELFFNVNGLALKNTTVINFLDGCAVSLPLGHGIGVSVCGLNGQDHKILNIAQILEKYLDEQLNGGVHEHKIRQSSTD